jgi:hypothetical protein
MHGLNECPLGLELLADGLEKGERERKREKERERERERQRERIE